MIAGVSGRLISASFAESELPAIAGHCTPPVDTLRALDAWSAHREAAFGPADRAHPQDRCNTVAIRLASFERRVR